MIRIERPKISPAELSGTKSNPSVGERERAEVIKFYALKSNLNKAFKFKAYKGKTVIEHLTSLFSGKCAYCESKYWGTQPVDVEHYRPKGGVMVPHLRSAKQSGRSRSTKASNTDQYKLRKPGYYWLAASWENLLPACIDCNRERNQKIPDQKEPGKFRIVKVGKANHFPLVDERKRRLTHKSRRLEEPLILDPTKDKPEQHLEFTEDGIVRPVRRRGEESPKGKSSIRVYALQRMGLVCERRRRAKQVLAQIRRVSELIADFDRRPDDSRLEQRLNAEMQELRSYTRVEEEYAGMARQLVKQFFSSVD